MELFIFSLFLFICCLFILKFNKRYLFFLLFFYCALYIEVSLILYLINDLGLLIGKKDQLGYYFYSIEKVKEYYNKNIFNIFIDIPIERSFHNFLYWIIYTFFSYASFYSPILAMRMLNFILHLGIGFLAYKSLYLLTENNKKAYTGMLFILLSPSLIIFDLYVIRDIMILFTFAGAFYFLLKFYKSKAGVLDIFIFILFTILTFSLRGQLGFVLFIIFLIVFVVKVFGIKSYIKLSLIFIFFIFLISRINIQIGGFGVIHSLIQSFFDVNFLKELVWRIPLYFLGLSFLDPTTMKDFSIVQLLIGRLVAPDSILIPIIFTYLLIRKKFSHYKLIIFAVLLACLFYFSLYIYASYYWSNEYGFHFRAFLPFFYIFYIFVLSTITIRIRYGKNILFSN